MLLKEANRKQINYPDIREYNFPISGNSMSLLILILKQPHYERARKILVSSRIKHLNFNPIISNRMVDKIIYAYAGKTIMTK